MLKLKFLILFIVFIQAVSNIIDFIAEQLIEGTPENKCIKSDGKTLKIETTAQCIERNSFLPRNDIGSKCCSFTGNPDPLVILKKMYGENWKKIIAQAKGYDLNISEEEVRKKLTENLNITINCQYVKKSPDSLILYGSSLATIDGIIKYDCGEGQKVFNGKEFHPTNKEEILEKQALEFFLLSYTEKDCLKKGKKFSDDNYQLCWCEEIKLSAGGSNEKTCIPFRASTFKETLTKLKNKYKKDNVKEEFKCTCLNNKSDIIIGRFNTITDEVKVE